MSRIIKNEQSWHKVTMTGGTPGDRITLIGGGKRAYLHIVPREDIRSVVIVSGEKSMRALARAILAEVGE